MPPRMIGFPLAYFLMRLVYAMHALSGRLSFTPPGVKSSSFLNLFVAVELATMESTHPEDTDQNSSGIPSLVMSSGTSVLGCAMIPTLNPFSISQWPMTAVPL